MIERRLQPIIARLREIERKCRALGPRNDEAREMADRVDGVVRELTRPREGEGPPMYAELARRLFPVARMFESLGFLSVAREVAHVDRLLTAMEPAVEARPFAPSTSAAPSSPVESPPPSEQPPSALEPPATSIEGMRRRFPPAVAAALVVLVLAVIVAVVLLVRSTPRSAKTPPAPMPAATSTPTPRLDPSPTPAGTAPAQLGLAPRSRLGDLIGEARLAYQDGRLDDAISLLSAAGSIDPTATSVLETADTLVGELVARSDDAAEAADWQRAADLLERARELAVRFDLPIAPIDDAARRHGRLVQFQRIAPANRPALEDAVGRRVIVLTEGTPVEGTLRSVGGTELRIELGLEIGDDGALIHTVDVPLRLVREVRVYPE